MLNTGEVLDILLHSESEHRAQHEGMSGHGSRSNPLQQQQGIACRISEKRGESSRPLADEEESDPVGFDDSDAAFFEGPLPPANPRTSEVQEQLEVLDALQQVALPLEQQPSLFRDKSKQRLIELKKKQREEAERIEAEQERLRKEKEAAHVERLRRIEVATRRLRRMQLKRAARLQKEQERAALREKQKQQEALRPRPPKSKRPVKGVDSAQDRRKKVNAEEARSAADEKHKQAMEAERQATLAREAARKRIMERLRSGAVAASAAEGALSIEGLRVAEKEGSRLDYQKQAKERLRQQARRKREEEERRKEEVQSQRQLLQERQEQAQQEVANVLDMAKRRAMEHLRNKHKDEEKQRAQQEEAKRAFKDVRQRYWKPQAVAEVKLTAPPMPTKEEVQRRAMIKRKHQQLELKRWMRENGGEPTAGNGEGLPREASDSTCLPEEATIDLIDGEAPPLSDPSQQSSRDEAGQEDLPDQKSLVQEQGVGPEHAEEIVSVLRWPHDDKQDADIGGKVVDVEEENDTEVSVAQAMAEAVVQGASGKAVDNDASGGNVEDGSSAAAPDVAIPEERAAGAGAGDGQGDTDE
mmetsp:Transcript_23961/g.55317  ORF Transcript_23961/g.55317 Transcript_23961/m.55317 type:complete len:585 (-) Transcript_23961:89-1843(-)